MDVDLNIATGYGSISIENKQPSHLIIKISDGKTLREVIRKQRFVHTLVESEMGKNVLQSFAVDILLRQKRIAKFERGHFIEGSRIYLLWQYLIAKLGF